MLLLQEFVYLGRRRQRGDNTLGEGRQSSDGVGVAQAAAQSVRREVLAPATGGDKLPEEAGDEGVAAAGGVDGVDCEAGHALPACGDAEIAAVGAERHHAQLGTILQEDLASSVIRVVCPPDAQQRLNRWVPRVVVDNRPEAIERDARRVLATPGWAEAWIAGEQFKYGYQTEIGRLLGKTNAGADRRYILAVAGKILEIYSSSTTSTTGEEDANRGKEADLRAVGQ